MARKGENIYKRKDGRWEGRVIQPDGKYRSFYAKTYRDVRAKMKCQKGERDSVKSTPAIPCDSAAIFFENWLKGDLYSRLKPSTYESYFRCTQKYILPHFRKPENTQLSEQSIVRFLKAVNEKTALSEIYRKKILSIFKTSLRDISQSQTQFACLLQYVALPKTSTYQKEIPVFSVKEQRSIEHAVHCSKDKRTVGLMLCFYTGIRIGELCALKWSDFDLEAGVMSVSRTVSRIQNLKGGGEKTYLHVGSPKSKASLRKIPLPAFLLELARARDPDSMNENNYLLSDKPDPFDPRIYQRIYKRVLKDAGIRDRKFHAIRHTFATRALEIGVDIKTLSELLGHSSVGITLNIYAHSLMEQKKIAIEKFNELHIVHMCIAECAVNSLVTPAKSAL